MIRATLLAAVLAAIFAAAVAAYVVHYTGTSAANNWTGSSGSDFADGRGGNDTLDGKGGADDLYGSEGADKLYGGSSNDELYAGCYPGASCGGSGSNNLLMGEGDDDRIGADNGKADTVSGGTGYDTCFVDKIDTLGIYGCEKTIEDGVVIRWDR